MININLVPLDLRRKKKKPLGGLKIPPEVIIGSGGGLLMLLICVHIIFLGVNLTKLAQHNTLTKEWEDMQPAKKNVDVVIDELKQLRDKQKMMMDLVQENEISWAEKLNIISENLPKGIWISKMNLTKQMLFIEGSSMSRQNKQMSNIHQFTANLKSNERFLNGFDSLELGSIERKDLGTVEIAEFLIKAQIHSEN